MIPHLRSVSGWSGTGRSTKSRRSFRRSLTQAVGPVLEQLEERRLLSATLSDGVLTVVGTNQADKIDVSVDVRRSNLLHVILNDTLINARLSKVHEIVINTLDGNDTVYVGGTDKPIPGVSVVVNEGDGNDFVMASASSTRLNAGSGSDTLVGGSAGDNHLWAGSGKDLLIAGTPNDVLHGGSGRDTFYTDGGGAIVLGKTSADRVFNRGIPAVGVINGIVTTEGRRKQQKKTLDKNSA